MWPYPQVWMPSPGEHLSADFCTDICENRRSREENFYYGHPQNRFWKVISTITNKELPKIIDENDYTNIVADKSGIITKIIAQKSIFCAFFFV